MLSRSMATTKEQYWLNVLLVRVATSSLIISISSWIRNLPWRIYWAGKAIYRICWKKANWEWGKEKLLEEKEMKISNSGMMVHSLTTSLHMRHQIQLLEPTQLHRKHWPLESAVGRESITLCHTTILHFKLVPTCTTTTKCFQVKEREIPNPFSPLYKHNTRRSDFLPSCLCQFVNDKIIEIIVVFTALTFCNYRVISFTTSAWFRMIYGSHWANANLQIDDSTLRHSWSIGHIGSQLHCQILNYGLQSIENGKWINAGKRHCPPLSHRQKIVAQHSLLGQYFETHRF